jgi:hypothetical protein
MTFKFLVALVHNGMPIKQNESPRGSSKPGREETRLLQLPRD